MTRPKRSRETSPAKPRRALRARAQESKDVLRLPSAMTTEWTGGHPRPLPPEVARQAQREMARLRRLPTGSAEAGQVRAYLQWLWSVPWDVLATEPADLKRVESDLHRDHLGLLKAKERVMEYLAVRRLKPDLPAPALCLVGPPGTGKSSLGAAVARALNRPFVRISVSGTSDVDELGGVARVSPGGQPGRILRALRDAGARNPVLMIDGVDRLSGEGGLRVLELLLDLLDRESSSRFTDRYLGMPVDLSQTVL